MVYSSPSLKSIIYCLLFILLFTRPSFTERVQREAYSSPTEWKRVNNYKKNINNDNFEQKPDYNLRKQSRYGSSDYVRESSINSHWCYYCATPRTAIEPSMVDAMDQLFDMRTTNYPFDSIYPQCGQLTNMTSNPPRTQRCKYNICHTITFTDTKGAKLTVRGCAEKMTAVHDFVNDYCRKVHAKLNIVECFCRNKHLCMNSSAKLHSFSYIWFIVTASLYYTLIIPFN